MRRVKRWMFAETAAEQAERRSVLAAADAWWEAFRQNEPAIRDDIALRGTLDLPALMSERLRAISPDLAWEFGPGAEDGHRLAITPEQNYHLAPLAEEVARRAPALPGWQFLDHRPPWPASWASEMMRVRTGAPCDDWHVIVSRTPVGNKLQLRFLAPGCKRSEDPEFLGRALVVVEVLLGEKVLREWVGPILVECPIGDPGESHRLPNPLHFVEREPELLARGERSASSLRRALNRQRNPIRLTPPEV